MANGIFIQRNFSIRDEYKEVVVNIYRSELQSLDFRGDPKGSAKTINELVAQLKRTCLMAHNHQVIYFYLQLGEREDKREN